MSLPSSTQEVVHTIDDDTLNEVTRSKINTRSKNTSSILDKIVSSDKGNIKQRNIRSNKGIISILKQTQGSSESRHIYLINKQIIIQID